MQLLVVKLEMTYSGGICNCVDNKWDKRSNFINTSTNKIGVVIIVSTDLSHHK